MRIPEYALTLLKSLPEAAMFVASDGQVLAVNRAARAALHLTSSQPTDCQLATLVADPSERLSDTLRTWSRSNEPMPGSFTVRGASAVTTYNAKGSVAFPRDDRGLTVLLVRFSMRSEANPFLLLNQKVAALNDEIARRTQVEDALRQSELALRERAREAEALNRAKDEFLATVSHELRTPLNAILGWASLLSGQSTDPHLEKGLSVIRRNAQAQARIIDDILDVSRIITGKLLLETSAVDLRTVVDDAAEVVRPSLQAKRIELQVQVPEEPCLITADPDRLRQAVWNLLSNAVKFSPGGGTVRVDVRREGTQAVLIVEDTGVGIDPAFLPLVFDRFKQSDGSSTRRAGGLGLGLSLVKHIVELHGGTAEADSPGLGQGAKFTISLPIRAAHQAAVKPLDTPIQSYQAAQLQAVNLRGARVLVVDDEPDARELLSSIIRCAEGEVACAESVREAFEVLERFRPDVVVSDVGMPDEDGHSFLRKLRKLAPNGASAVPAVALTAYTRPEDEALALAAGFDVHLGKPVDAGELLSVLAKLAEGSQG